METSRTRTPSNLGVKITAMLCLIVCVLAFIFSCLKNVLPIGAGIVGTFGIFAYPMLILLALLSLAKFLGFSYRRSKKATAFMVVFVLCLLFVIHCIRTYSALDAVSNAKTFKAYLELSYSKLTVLGSVGSVVAGILSLVIGGIGAIVVFVILATLMIGLFVDFELYGKYEDKHIKKLKTRREREKVYNSDRGAVDGNPNYSFSNENNYKESDVVSETFASADDLTTRQTNEYQYTDGSVASEVEANPEDYANSVDYTSGQTNEPQNNYESINFFGGAQNQQSGYANPFGVDAVDYSETPNFSNDVYKEEEYPNVFTDSMDEYRRKFMQDTFGGANSGEANAVTGETSSQPSPEPQNTFNFSQISSSETKPQNTDMFGFVKEEPTKEDEPKVSSSNPFESFSFNEPASQPVSQPVSQPTFEPTPSETLNFGSESENSSSIFPGLIGSNIDDTKNSTSSSALSGVDEGDENDEGDFNLGTDLSSLFGSISDEDEDDDLTTSSNSAAENSSNFFGFNTSTSNSNTSSSFNLDEDKKPEKPLDFSFLHSDENNSFEEKLISDDVNPEPVSKPSAPLFAENKITSSNDNLIITSSNPIEPKITVQPKEPQKKFSGYNLGMSGIRYNPPPLSLLKPSTADTGDYSEEQQRKSSRLEDALKAFNIPAKVVNIIRGPKITRYELSVPLGVPVKKIPMYELDIKRALAAKTINIQAPIPGSSYVGIELENDTFTSVSQRELLESDAFQNCKDPLPIAIGKDISGEIVVKSLAKMVHLLIAGSTGSGKSVFIHSLVMSLIFKHSPEDLRLIMIDPKKVEFNRYNGLPHLLTPEVVMGADKAINALKWCVKEMDRRYDLMSRSGYNNIEPYNRSELVKAGQFEKFPYIVIIVDELAEIMMVNKKEVEGCIQRITQLARACGMHLVLATQRPSVDIISGVIKNNVPSRIAFSLSSGIDSKTILNTVGAEKLLGQGDMLFSPNGTSSMPRLQAAYCSDEEIKSVIEFDKQNNSANYDDEVSNVINAEQTDPDEVSGQVSDMPAPRELDGYFKTAVKIVMQNGGASTSYLQRRLAIGYSRAAKIIDQMEDKGYIAPATGSKIRKVLITPDQFKQDFNEDYSDVTDI